MPNPALLLCDTDVLIQLFLVDDLRPLDALKKRFGIQATIPIEVDLELRWIRKYRDRFVAPLDKALKRGTLAKLDPSFFQSFLGSAVAGTSWSTYQTLGSQFYGYVQRGEAYTHAAAVSLGMPAASNDNRAIETMRAQMLPIPAPVLRSFDLIVFAYYDGILDLRDCEAIRKQLVSNGEWISRPFLHACFEDSAKQFNCRIRQTTVQMAHLITPCIAHNDPLVIVPL